MKKIFCIAVLSACLLCNTFSLFATGADWFFIQGAIGSSAVIYTDKDIQAQNNSLETVGIPFRFILDCDVAIGFVLDPHVRVLAGALLSTDFLDVQNFYAHRLDYGFYTGLQVYPSLAGLCFGVDYVVGSRTDFTKLPKDSIAKTFFAPWGNGFRFVAEYDFANGSTTVFAPILCLSYRLMPRGGSYDHKFSLSFKAGF